MSSLRAQVETVPANNRANNRSNPPMVAVPDRRGKLYINLYQRLRSLIVKGIWPAGTRLPSTRVLASDLGISRNTALLAVQQLMADGWVVARRGSGVFVSGDALVVARSAATAAGNHAPAPLPLFAPGGLPTDLFPIERWQALVRRVWSRMTADLLGEAPGAGDPGLRQVIAHLICATRGIDCTVDDVIITAGIESALDLATAVLCMRGEGVIVEDPSFPQLSQFLAARGFHPLPIPVDQEGIITRDVRDKTSARVAIVSPGAQMPCGVIMSPWRRAALLDWADRSTHWIIELDDDTDLVFDGSKPLPPLRHESERVVLIGSFGRALFPGLRIGFLIAPPALRSAFHEVQESLRAVPHLPAQLVLRDFIDEGHYAAHMRKRRLAVTERRQALLKLLRPGFGRVFARKLNPAGVDLVLEPSQGSAGDIIDAFNLAGISASGLSPHVAPNATHERVLLGFAGMAPERIAAAGPAFSRVLRAL